MKSDDKAKVVNKFWSKVKCSSSEKNFYSFPYIRSRSSKLIFGETDAARIDWCEYWTIKKYLKGKIPLNNVLSICCGFGEVERTLVKLGAVKKILGLDIAEGAVAQARKSVANEGLKNITYEITDLNKIELPTGKFDLIWSNGALHHLANIDNVAAVLYKALRPGGILVANEYVGPKYQQLGPRQREIINAVKHLLPAELRGDLKPRLPLISLVDRAETQIEVVLEYIYKRFFQSENSKIYGQIWYNTPLKYFEKLDPSESISGREIIPVLKRTFDKVEIKPYYGSILQYALDKKFYNNFDFTNPAHRKILDLLFVIEETLVDINEISNDNAHIISWKKI